MIIISRAFISCYIAVSLEAGTKDEPLEKMTTVNVPWIKVDNQMLGSVNKHHPDEVAAPTAGAGGLQMC